MKWLVWLYPAEWRRRYADEFLTLIEDRGGSPSAVLDVLLGAIDAWLHPHLVANPAPARAANTLAPQRGSGRFDRFTERSRNVLRLAEHEADRLQHASIGTEHLLLGLLLERRGIAARVLAELGVGADGVRVDIESRLARVDPADRVRVGLTPDAKRAIVLGVDEANRLRHSFFGTEHLLLGIAAAGDTGGAQLLQQHGAADVDDLRRRIKRMLEGDCNI